MTMIINYLFYLTFSSVQLQLILSILNLKDKFKSLEIFLKTLSGHWQRLQWWSNFSSFRPSCRARRAGTSWWAGWCTASTPGRDGGWWGTSGRRATWRRGRRGSSGERTVNSQIHPSTTAAGKPQISTIIIGYKNISPPPTSYTIHHSVFTSQ